MEKIKKIYLIALPIILQGIVFQLQSLTDKIFLGRLSDKYISALGAASVPYYTVTETIFALSVGLVIIVSRLYGQKRYGEIDRYTRSFATYTSFITIAVCILWQFFARFVLIIFQVDEAIIGYGVEYITVCALGLLTLGVDAAFEARLQGMGHTAPIFYCGLIKVVLNIVLTYGLIFGKFGITVTPVIGAAIGTTAANYVSVIALLAYVFFIDRGNEDSYQSGYSRNEISVAPFVECIKIGVPTAMEYFLWNGSNMVLMAFLNSLSYRAMAIYTLTFSIEFTVYSVFNGIGKAVMTLIGNSAGRGDHEEANAYLKIGVVSNILFSMLSIAAFALFNGPIMSVFTTESYLIETAGAFLVFNGVILLPKSFNVLIGNAVRAYKHAKWMLYSQIAGSVFVIAVSFVLIKVFALGLTAIYLTVFFDEALRGTINTLYYIKKIRTAEAKNVSLA